MSEMYSVDGIERKKYSKEIDNTNRQILVLQVGLDLSNDFEIVKREWADTKPIKYPDMTIYHKGKPILCIEVEEQNRSDGGFNEGTFERKRENKIECPTILWTFNRDYTKSRVIKWKDLSNKPDPYHKLPNGERFVHASKEEIDSTIHMIKELKRRLLNHVS